MAGWKAKTLSLASRQVLAQSVLSSIPFYTMQTTLIPKRVIANMEKLIRGFLWGNLEGEKRCNLVRWDTVTKSKENGGLGIRKLAEMNIAFLAKLEWRIMMNEESLWVRVLKAKYAIQSMDCSMWRPKTNMSNSWQGILLAAPTLQQGTRKLVRNGRNTLFWIGDVPLKDRALSIPLTDINNSVADYWDKGWKWNRLENLLPNECLRSIAAAILAEEDSELDSTGWKGGSSANFTVNSAYKIATSERSPVEAAKWNNIWKLKIPNRIKTFICLARHEKILTNDNRRIRGLTEDDKCWNCPNVTEDTDHVLRRFPIAAEI